MRTLALRRSLGRAATLSLLSLVLTACVTGNRATQDVTTAERTKGGLFGMSEYADMEVNKPKAFAGKSKLIIGSFKVGFVDSKRAEAKAGGGIMGSAYGGKSVARLKLEGVDDQHKQALTEVAYNSFTQRLQKAGYEIVELGVLQGYKGYEKVKLFDFPLESDNSGLLSDYGVTYYHTPAVFGKTHVYMGEIPGESGGFGFSSPNAVTAEFAKATGIPVINVSYVLDFANTGSYGDFFTSTSSVSVGQGMTLVPGANLGIISGWGGSFSDEVGSLRTGQPLTSDIKFAAVEDSTTDTHKTVQTVTNVVGLLGGIGSNITRDYIVRADPERFEAAAIDVIEQINEAFVLKMAELR
ncbi:hypothetical protein [Marinobacterium litorale]|uniref:hypothetical protein n=1 Tax=Marinobacterium litorale TaxID=404770 RepID=UPI0003F6D520|nr:hypothetical protein [Marinobacterium litorale]